MDIVTLAQEFGLPCIRKGNIYYIIGENDIIELLESTLDDVSALNKIVTTRKQTLE